MQHEHNVKKLNFDLLTPPPGSGDRGVRARVGGGGLRAKYLLTYCCIPDYHVLKKLNLDLLTSPGSGVGGGGKVAAGKIFATILLHT